MLLICASHSPLQLTDIEATDPDKHRGYFQALDRCANALASFRPDFIVVFAPDHFNGLFYDLMPSFCIGVEAQSTQDWGIAQFRVPVPREEALACARNVMAQGIDAAISYRLHVDHGTTIPLIRLRALEAGYPVMPVLINCAADPRPSFQRVRQFGSAIGAYLAQCGKKVVIVGSGGLSHDPPTPRLARSSGAIAERLIVRHVPARQELEERQGRVMAACRALVRGEGPMLPPNNEWDRDFVSKFLAQDLESLDQYTDEYLDRVAGFGAHEVRCWVAAAAAMKAAGAFSTEERFYGIIPEWATGMSVVTGQHWSDGIHAFA